MKALEPVHQAQLITYLKLTGCPAGLLMNFNVPLLANGIRRVLHPELYRQELQTPTNPKDIVLTPPLRPLKSS